jgi:thioredoxin-related protein
MKQVLCLMIVVPLFAKTQIEQKGTSTSFSVNSGTGKNSGIQWIEGLSWQQVKDKAKQENKYIFLDCFATWCGPCKLMDKNVYTNDTVGNYFNTRFIAVRVQMDKTKKDNEFIQSWYSDADSINKNYRIEAYPTFIFLSPMGVPLHRATGYKGVKDLVTLAETAMIPGKIYEDPYAEYERLVTDYKRGIKHYDRMPYMITAAYKSKDDGLAKQLLNEHTDYVIRLKPIERYTKNNIELWAGFTLRSDGPRFNFFYKDGDQIDKVMNEKGYAAAIVDRTIQKEIVDSFYKIHNGKIMFKKLPIRMDGKIEPDYVEADWKKLEKMIRQKFNRECAKRNVLKARVQWYLQHRNYPAYTKYGLLEYKKYPPHNLHRQAMIINDFCWFTFLYVKDKNVLNSVIPWAEKAIKAIEHAKEYNVVINSCLRDTYANLLYKVGRKLEAIKWQENACKWDPTNREMKEALEQMKSGQHTYVKRGAMWK